MAHAMELVPETAILQKHPLLTFEDGAFATLTYNGYGHFDSDEFQGWIGELGQRKEPSKARLPRSYASPADEAAAKNAGSFGGATYQPAVMPSQNPDETRDEQWNNFLSPVPAGTRQVKIRLTGIYGPPMARDFSLISQP